MWGEQAGIDLSSQGHPNDSGASVLAGLHGAGDRAAQPTPLGSIPSYGDPSYTRQHTEGCGRKSSSTLLPLGPKGPTAPQPAFAKCWEGIQHAQGLPALSTSSSEHAGPLSQMQAVPNRSMAHVQHGSTTVPEALGALGR